MVLVLKSEWMVPRVETLKILHNLCNKKYNEDMKSIEFTDKGKNNILLIVADEKGKTGNIDLALLDEQKFYGIQFGINSFPKTRRHNPPPDTIKYDPSSVPNNIRPYLMLTNKAKSTWVNNHKKGIEKVLLAWDSLDRDTLSIYLICYERITPVWMARVRIDDDTVDRARLRRRLYMYK